MSLPTVLIQKSSSVIKNVTPLDPMVPGPVPEGCRGVCTLDIFCWCGWHLLGHSLGNISLALLLREPLAFYQRVICLSGGWVYIKYLKNLVSTFWSV